jgi:uncharacterized membrane protein
MIRTFTRSIPLALLLASCTFIPVMTAAVAVVQIPLGALPEESLRLASAPVTLFLHSLAGVLFGVLGPLQFVRALRARFGTLHRLAGRVFVLAGAVLALAGLGLLLQVESIAAGLLDAARGVFGLMLMAALVRGTAAARVHDMRRHRAWMIRAYAIGMGQGTAALVLFPIYLITREPPTGLATAVVVVGLWLLNIAAAEWAVRRLAGPSRRPGTTPPSLVTKAAALFLPWVLCGCAATTSVEFAGQRPAAPVCQGANAPLSAVVVWGPNWRPDQKDVGAREQAAERGIADFFATQDCFARTQVQRLARGTLGSLDEANAAAAASGIGAQRVVYIVVKELGPVVKLLSSAALIEGGTEVVLDVAIYDPAHGQQGRFTTHWRHGGAGVVKGAASLPGDMRTALATALGVRAE